MKPTERQELLRRSLERDREAAWARAHYERQQRDEYTSKLRFGLVAVNAASLLTVLNAGTAFAALSREDVLLSAGLFVIGTVTAGYSLVVHQSHLITLTGDVSSRAMLLDQAVTLAECPADSVEYAQLGGRLDKLLDLNRKVFAHSIGALRLQWLSMSCWIAAAGVIAFAELRSFLPSWIT